MSKKQARRHLVEIVAVLIALSLFFALSKFSGHDAAFSTTAPASTACTAPSAADLGSLPEYSNSPYVVINNNNPDFKNTESIKTSYEKYGKLDALKRCTQCEACIGEDLMPQGERSSISSVKPTGWQSAKYDFIDGKNLYNRCHLIAYRLTGENANAQNLITGTRYMNTKGMLPFEDEVADYVKSSGNHVLYRVTPVFKGNELVARGVHMQALSLEDGGDGVRFNVYCYNVQPGVDIDYKTGKSRADKSSGETTYDKNKTAAQKSSTSFGNVKSETYIINKNNKKFHRPDCEYAKQIKENNKESFTGDRAELIEKGYTPCKSCKP